MPSPAPVRLVALLLLALAADARCDPVSLTDDRGVSVTLPRPAARIVALAPHLAELTAAAGAGAQLVGVSAHSDHPPELAALPAVADAAGLDVERLLALRPDLVLAWLSGNPPAALRQLEAVGVAVFATEPARLGDVPRLLRLIGNLAGTATRAEAAAARYEQRLAALRARHSGGGDLSVFYQLWPQPLMTVSGAHIISDVIALCGGRNVFAHLPGLTPLVSAEAVAAADPQVILASGTGEALARWRRLPALRAVRGGALLRVDADLLQRATPRVLDAAERLCLQLGALRQRR